MRLQEAQRLAGEVVSRLAPYCSAIEVVGSIRRKRAQPRDIDIVCIVKLPMSFTEELKNLAAGGHLSRRATLSSTRGGYFSRNNVEGEYEHLVEVTTAGASGS